MLFTLKIARMGHSEWPFRDCWYLLKVKATVQKPTDPRRPRVRQTPEAQALTSIPFFLRPGFIDATSQKNLNWKIYIILLGWTKSDRVHPLVCIQGRRWFHNGS